MCTFKNEQERSQQKTFFVPEKQESNQDGKFPFPIIGLREAYEKHKKERKTKKQN